MVAVQNPQSKENEKEKGEMKENLPQGGTSNLIDHQWKIHATQHRKQECLTRSGRGPGYVSWMMSRRRLTVRGVKKKKVRLKRKHKRRKEERERLKRVGPEMKEWLRVLPGWCSNEKFLEGGKVKSGRWYARGEKKKKVRGKVRLFGWKNKCKRFRYWAQGQIRLRGKKKQKKRRKWGLGNVGLKIWGKGPKRKYLGQERNLEGIGVNSRKGDIISGHIHLIMGNFFILAVVNYFLSAVKQTVSIGPTHYNLNYSLIKFGLITSYPTLVLSSLTHHSFSLISPTHPAPICSHVLALSLNPNSTHDPPDTPPPTHTHHQLHIPLIPLTINTHPNVSTKTIRPQLYTLTSNTQNVFSNRFLNDPL